jgi:hypothetical protein
MNGARLPFANINEPLAILLRLRAILAVRGFGSTMEKIEK